MRGTMSTPSRNTSVMRQTRRATVCCGGRDTMTMNSQTANRKHDICVSCVYTQHNTTRTTALTVHRMMFCTGMSRSRGTFLSHTPIPEAKCQLMQVMYRIVLYRRIFLIEKQNTKVLNASGYLAELSPSSLNWCFLTFSKHNRPAVQHSDWYNDIFINTLHICNLLFIFSRPY